MHSAVVDLMRLAPRDDRVPLPNRRWRGGGVAVPWPRLHLPQLQTTLLHLLCWQLRAMGQPSHLVHDVVIRPLMAHLAPVTAHSPGRLRGILVCVPSLALGPGVPDDPPGWAKTFD